MSTRKISLTESLHTPLVSCHLAVSLPISSSFHHEYCYIVKNYILLAQMMKNKNYGFTLIEILVVVGIISMLSSIVLVSTSNIRNKAEDTRRLSDMRQIVNALQLYNLEHGKFPDSDNECIGGWDSSSDGDFLHVLTQEGFLPKDFLDPRINNNNSNCGNYQYHRYDQGMYGCNEGRYYVLEIVDMQSTPGYPGNGGSVYPGSPGWKCPSYDWNSYAEWVTGMYE